MKKRIVIKIGTSTLTAGTKRLSFGKIEDLAREVERLKNEYDVIIVSSGAIAAARQFSGESGIKEMNGNIGKRQAMAAIGQPRLMMLYGEVFERYSIHTAQCLLTHYDFEHSLSLENTRNTLLCLLEYGYVPVVNENDTVATEEIIVGDNDRLSAMVATAVGADLLIIVSDIDGLYDSDPRINSSARLIREVNDIKSVSTFAGGTGSASGTGGMVTKLKAAGMCLEKGIEMWIVNGSGSNFIKDAMEGKKIFTKFKNTES